MHQLLKYSTAPNCFTTHNEKAQALKMIKAHIHLLYFIMTGYTIIFGSQSKSNFVVVINVLLPNGLHFIRYAISAIFVKDIVAY